MINTKLLKGMLVFLLCLFISVPVLAKINKKEIRAKIATISVPFIKNVGQVNKLVSFYAHTFGGTVFVTKTGKIVYSLPKIKKTKDKKQKITGWVISESLLGTKIKKVKGLEKTITKVNYLIGKKKNWRISVASYKEITLGEVYKGINLGLKAYGNNVEKIFKVESGGNPEKICLKISGAKNIKVSKDGRLIISTPLGEISFTKPKAYQEIRGKRHYVEVSYIVKGKNKYGFNIKNYNKNKELIIDPLLASTYLGGNDDDDFAEAIAIDSAGNVYVTGYTYSTDFPTTTGAYAIYTGYEDAFISKLDSNLTTLLASTYLGGSDDDQANAIAIDSAGNVYVTGYTYSTDFPTTTGAYAIYTGDEDVFISKLDSNLTTLLASTYLGGSDDDQANAIAIDSAGNVYVTGYTYSTDFPATTGAYAIYSYGYGDAFISKLDSNLTTLLASTYLGGTYTDQANAIAIDNLGDIYVAGWTTSTDFPTTANAYYTSGGYGDVFISKLDSNLTTLLASTYLGGSDIDKANAIAIDNSGNVYVTGNTVSPDFPTTTGAYDTIFSGNVTLNIGDVFVSKLDGNLTTLLASTYLGGSNDDKANAIAIDSAGNVYVTGYTYSTDFPTTTGAYALNNAGYHDAFISKLDSNLITLLASTYLGGSDEDGGFGIAIDSTGNIYIAGDTASTDFPTTTGAYDTTAGYGDAFISKLDSNLSGGIITTTTTTTTTTSTSTFSTPSSSGGGGGGCTMNSKINNIGLGIPLLIVSCFLWAIRRKIREK